MSKRKIGYAAKLYVENCSDCPFNNSTPLVAFYSCKLQENPKRFYAQKSDMFLDCKLDWLDEPAEAMVMLKKYKNK